jgi:hypothetical protein
VSEGNVRNYTVLYNIKPLTFNKVSFTFLPMGNGFLLNQIIIPPPILTCHTPDIIQKYSLPEFFHEISCNYINEFNNIYI